MNGAPRALSHDADPVVIVSAADGHYARPLAVMLGSLVAHLGPERSLQAHVIDGGIPQALRACIEQSLPTGRVRLEWHEPDRSALLGVPLWGRMPISTYDKLLVPELLPEELRKAIWLDADTLVLADVGALWDMPLQGMHALAVQDSLVPFIGSRFGVAGYRDRAIAPGAKYFNAGVMVVGLEAWRRGDIAGTALRYVKQYSRRVSFWDQEGLNAALAGRWTELDPAWNTSATMTARSLGASHMAGPRILHFSGAVKPWKYHVRSPLYETYNRYLDATPCSGVRPAASWRSRAFKVYDGGALRRFLYPAEQIATGVRMALTRRRVFGRRPAGVVINDRRQSAYPAVVHHPGDGYGTRRSARSSAACNGSDGVGRSRS